MADKKNNAEDIKKLYKKLSLAPEFRDEPSKGQYPKGRFRQVFDVFSAEMNTLMRVNLWFILFFIPFFAVLFYYMPYVKNEAVLLYNFMGNIGIGYPGGSDSAVQGVIAVYKAYQNVLYLLIPAFAISSVGLAGSFTCYRKYMWGEKVKSITKTFFGGVKKFWYKYLIVAIVDSLLVLAAGSTLIFFLTLNATGSANAGHWVMLIVVLLAAFLLLYVNMQLLPMLCTLDLPLRKHLKNALIFSYKFAPIGIIIWILCVLPMLFIFMANSFLSMLIYMLIIMFGFVLYGLSFTGFAQLAIDNVLTPLYQLSISYDKDDKKKNKAKLKPNQPLPQGYKKKGNERK